LALGLVGKKTVAFSRMKRHGYCSAQCCSADEK
jgi:hypothetical protein